jgi:VIT1/CCC1 family predicted Fe2+/Mn2+ transporter
VRNIFANYGLTPEQSEPIVEALSQHSEAWVDFMMRFELGLEAPDPRRALTSAVTIALSYIVGGLIPLSPYILLPVARTALLTSVVVTLLALLIFGYIKGQFTGAVPIKSGLQTALIGGLAAAVAFAIARLIS